MSTSREDVIRTIRDSAAEIEEVADSLSDEALATGVYEAGWNAKQLLCHLVAGGSFASVMITLAKLPGDSGSGRRPDQDAWNAAQVASRQDSPLADLLSELRSTSNRSIETVQQTPDDLLYGHFRAPWDAEGSLAAVIVEALEDHVGTHLAELRGAIA